MPNGKLKTKPKNNVTGQPWLKEGISYQQWYYRNRKKPARQQSQPSASTPVPKHGPGLPSFDHHPERNPVVDKVMINEFLNRCDMDFSDTIHGGMTISGVMAHAIYNTLRDDGH